MADRKTGVYHRDDRVDKAISWTLATVAIILMGIGTYFFNDLSGSIKGLDTSVGKLNTEVAVMRKDMADLDSVKTELSEVRKALQAHEIKLTLLMAKVGKNDG